MSLEQNPWGNCAKYREMGRKNTNLNMTKNTKHNLEQGAPMDHCKFETDLFTHLQ